jgi:hypothetical protein
MSSLSATPNVPEVSNAVKVLGVKPATPDVIVFNDQNIPIEYLTDLLFEMVGGQEILSVSRNDTINGQRLVYNPIKNISELGKKYSSFNIFNLPGTINSYFDNFAIKLDTVVPYVGTNVLAGEVETAAYIDTVTGGLSVYVSGVSFGDQVEIRVLRGGGVVGDILYTDEIFLES